MSCVSCSATSSADEGLLPSSGRFQSDRIICHALLALFVEIVKYLVSSIFGGLCVGHVKESICARQEEVLALICIAGAHADVMYVACLD